MIWPFTRKRKPAPERPPINEDWCAGDLACCTSSGNWDGGFGPAPNSIHRVTEVVAGFSRDRQPGWGLGFANWPHAWFNAIEFVKVRPDAEECSAEFKEMIQRTVRKPVDAGVDQ